ncbi:MAG: hypothetical protein IPL73_07510 [Candidatus Obscuribacter sp.]|nr:hypothetical protein [Candidatus Obscuribacter sp.]
MYDISQTKTIGHITRLERLSLSWALALTAIVCSAGQSMAFDKDQSKSKATFVSDKKIKPIAIVATNASDKVEISQAEAGLKLLINIFNRLGNEPQLALKNELQSRSGDMRIDKKQMVANASQFGGSGGAMDQDGINSNMLVSNTDPALAIRPQGSRRLNVGRAVLNKTVPVDSIAIAMAKEEHKPYARPMLAEKAGGKAAASGMSADYSKVASLKSADEGFSDQEKSLDVQANNVKKTSRSEEIAANRRKQVAIPYLAGSNRSTIVPLQDQNHIREFKGEVGLQTLDDAPKVNDYRATGFVGSKEVTLGESDAGIIRPSEQPGLFKYVKEHKQQQLPSDIPRDALAKDSMQTVKAKGDLQSMPVPASAAPAALPQSSIASRANRQSARYNYEPNSYGVADKKSKSSFNAPPPAVSSESLGRMRQSSYSVNQVASPLVAFLPPSTIRGISGLALGSKESDTVAYFKERGKSKVTDSHGWKIYTLLNSDNTIALQAYVHNGFTEALRVFQPNFVPSSIGVTIADDLSEMKSKFGEPSFILEEPRASDEGTKVMAKNYVYPLSQLGFQLARPVSDAKPQIKSVLLFRYL